MTGVGCQQPLRRGDARADHPPPEVMSAEDREMVLRGLEQARNGEYATEEEVRATLARFRLRRVG